MSKKNKKKKQKFLGTTSSELWNLLAQTRDTNEYESQYSLDEEDELQDDTDSYPDEYDDDSLYNQ